MNSEMFLRNATVADQPAIIQLIDAVYQEYGDRVHLPGAESDLLDIQQNYFAKGGAFVVLDDAGCVKGCHAALPADGIGKVCTFRRLYLHADLRGSGWGERLMQWAIDWAVEHGFQKIEFWSDTRFQRAHQFFGKFGFVKDGRVREMHDGAVPYSEYFFQKVLDQA